MLSRQGWAAALMTADGHLEYCNKLFRQQLQKVGALNAPTAGQSPKLLQIQEWGSAVEHCPVELQPWQEQMRRVTLRCSRQDGTVRDVPAAFTILPLALPENRLLAFAAVTTESVVVDEVLQQALDQCGVAALLTDAQARISYVNQRFSEITGYAPEQVMGRNPRILQSGRMPQRTYQDMWGRLSAGASWEGRVLNRRACGDHYWSFQTISPLYQRGGSDTQGRGTLIGYLSLSHDNTTMYDDYLSLHQLAYYDSLCGIANRRALQNHLSSVLETAEDHPRHSVILLLINLDHFKLINDGYGHEAGDAVLRAVSERIMQRNYLRGFMARLDGDEFALVVSGYTDEHAILRFADALLDAVTRPIEVEGHKISVSASIGVALAPAHAEQVSQLMRCADTATQAAKSAGRNCSLMFHPSMLEAGDTRIAERGVLEQALENNELFPVFQPVVSCAERGIAYYEALVRWQHPELGTLAPAQFLPAFKRFGLMARLNRWMLDHASAELSALGPHACLSLNIAAPDLMLDGYAEHVQAALARHDIDPARIRLEITEGELIENFTACEASITRLRDAGMRLYIDDFGVGYASLAYLKRLPVDGVKLDRSFLQDFPGDAQAVDIIASIIGLAHRLDLEVTAEGVETLEQARLLMGLGCDYLQGFLFGRPVLAEFLPQRPVRR